MRSVVSVPLKMDASMTVSSRISRAILSPSNINEPKKSWPSGRRTSSILLVYLWWGRKKRFNPYEATTLEDAPKILPTDSDRVKKQKKRIVCSSIPWMICCRLIKSNIKPSKRKQSNSSKTNRIHGRTSKRKLKRRKIFMLFVWSSLYRIHVRIATMKEVKPNTRPF